MLCDVMLCYVMLCYVILYYIILYYIILYYIILYYIILYYIIYSLTAIWLAPGDSSAVHVHTNNTQNNTMKHNTWNGTHVTIRIYKHNKEYVIYKIKWRHTKHT